MKKVWKYIFVITLILCLAINSNVFAAYEKITLEEVKTYLEENVSEEEELKSIMIEENAIKMELQDNQFIKFFYDSQNDIFYAEETFDNTMNEEYVINQLSTMVITPFYGFFAVSDKNGVEETVHQQYAVENGLMASAFSMLGVELQPNVVEGIDSYIDDEFQTGMSFTCDYYSVKLEKTRQNETITIRNSLTINTEADFSKMAEKIEKQSNSITEENADYSARLKVGETYTIQTNEKFNGYIAMGEGEVEFSEGYTEITAVAPGVVYGYLYIGEAQSEEQRTFYITITASEGDQDEEQPPEEDKDNTIITSPELPQTGEKNLILMIIAGCIICAIFMRLKNKEYKDIR